MPGLNPFDGELIQVDGSEQRWFEDRGAPFTLLVLIDGRVQRANRTLQGRLVKELRLAGVCDMDITLCCRPV